jgi:hypothetical protein
MDALSKLSPRAMFALYGANYDRLVEAETAYDPENVFRLNQNIRSKARSRVASQIVGGIGVGELASGRQPEGRAHSRRSDHPH